VRRPAEFAANIKEQHGKLTDIAQALGIKAAQRTLRRRFGDADSPDISSSLPRDDIGHSASTARLEPATVTGHNIRMASYEYRIIEDEDGRFLVELWPTRQGGERIFRSRGFQTRELAEAWLVPVQIQSTDPPSPRSRVVYIKR
jgi:hypothetical protein